MKLPSRFAIRPSETIFSAIFRWHRYSCHPFNYMSYNALFETQRTRVHPFLPHGINLVAKQLDRDPQQLLLENTLYSLFVFFNPKVEQQLNTKLIYGNRPVMGMVGVTQAKLPLAFSHKVCPHCLGESYNNLGYLVLRIEHQIPGMKSCFKHEVRLQDILAGDGYLDRQIRFPYDHANDEVSSDIELKFSAFSARLFTLCKIGITCDCIALYRRELSKKGYITKNNRIRITPLRNELILFINNNPQLLDDGIRDLLGDFNFIGPLLRKKTGFPSHPIKHLLFSFWLFKGKVSLFLNKIKISKKRKPLSKTVSQDDFYIIELLNNNVSMNEIKSITGASICYIKRRADLNGIAHETNANRFSDAIKRSVIRKALMGTHRKTIAEDCGIGIGYVEQVIGNTPLLTKHRAHLRRQAKIYWAVNLIKEEVRLHPDWHRTKIRMSQQAAYGALYNLDKSLIDIVLPKAIVPAPPKKDWKPIDAMLVELISSFPDVEILSRSAISRKIKWGRYLINSLHHLPNTKKLLSSLDKS
jgi:hypothetical protein